MTHCPSCGRYVGPYDACPYCGATLGGRTLVRSLKIAALILALGGLILLWLLATQTGVPTVEIGQANAMMNMAYVRVQGMVSRQPSYDPDTGYFSFWLQDETGELRVAAYRNESRALLSEARIPALGDWVAVEGTLRVREELVSLTLNVPQRLEIRRAEPLPCAIGDITAQDAFKPVHVRAQIRGLRSPYAGLTLVGLRDGSGEIELAISEVITALGDDLPALTVGHTVEVIAPVSLYKDIPQLSLARATDLIPLPGGLFVSPQRTIYQITGGRAGEWVSVEGHVTAVTPFSSGVKATLEDGTGRITLLLWQNLYDQLTAPDGLAVGATLHVQGQATKYQGEWEIVPELVSDIRVVNPAPPASATPVAGRPDARPKIHSIGALTSEQIGERVTLTATVRAAASFAQGFKFTLDDGSGQITLLTWLNVYDGIAGREKLRVGASVRASGEIDLFEGALQLVPISAADVTLVREGADLALQRQTGSFTPQDVGKRVSVTGEITRVEPFSSGMRVYVDDGSGEVLLLLWQNLLERVPEQVGVTTVGRRLHVTGQVELYQGAFEIVPALPFDVAVAP